ncbi:MAG: hypothetical protein ACODAD_02490 [Planctomycetota bacterium]
MSNNADGQHHIAESHVAIEQSDVARDRSLVSDRQSIARFMAGLFQLRLKLGRRRPVKYGDQELVDQRMIAGTRIAPPRRGRRLRTGRPAGKGTGVLFRSG